TPEGEARVAELLERFEPECAGLGDEVRASGGLYVLGTERHESRRIDNQRMFVRSRFLMTAL
ncbi:MAG: hypothetical protein VCC01_05160, partial [Candidatus Hydrogenedentota bacterium]